MLEIYETKDVDTIIELNNIIFGDQINEDYIKAYIYRKNYDSKPFYFLLLKNHQKIGYAVCFTKNKTFFTIWLIGIIAEFRNSGHGSFFYQQIEKYAKDNSFTDIEVVTYNKRRNMLSLLIKNNFFITNTSYSFKRNDTKIIFNKRLNINQSHNISAYP